LVSCILISVGFLFKIFHLPGASALLVFGNGGALLIFIPLLLFNKQQQAKTSFEKRKDIVALVSFAVISLGGLLKGLHLVTANETLIIGFAVFCFGYLPMLFLKMYRESIAA